jgi:hypothetical protein
MTDLQTAAQQALECLKGVARGKYDGNAAGVCVALEAALAQQAEPVAWMVYTLDGKSVCVTDNPDDFSEGHRALPLYTAPPQRPAEPVQEPVAWYYERDTDKGLSFAPDRDPYKCWQPLYTAPPQQAEPVDTDCHTQGICQRSGYGITQQAEPVEPVAWAEAIIDDLHALHDTELIREVDSGDALIRLDAAIAAVEEAEQRHTSLPQRKPLTEEEIQAAWDSVDMRHPRGNETRIAFARAIESKLQEKNT